MLKLGNHILNLISSDVPGERYVNLCLAVRDSVSFCYQAVPVLSGILLKNLGGIDYEFSTGFHLSLASAYKPYLGRGLNRRTPLVYQAGV